MVVQRTYKYRIYPSKKQIFRLNKSFCHCKFVYNELLGLNKKLWISKKFEFNGLVKDIKTCHPEIAKETHSQVLQNCSDRLAKAFDSFFRRLKTNEKAGFPRFKSKINSITFPQSGFKLLSERRLKLSKVGSVPIVLSRVPKGKIKTLTIKQNRAGQWFAVFSCEVDMPEIQHTSTESVGIDLGLTDFAVVSNGESIDNPRFLRKSEKRLNILQRRLSRKKKGSNNRIKFRIKVARQHLKIVNKRTDWLHKNTTNLVNRYQMIAVENLNIKNMVKNHCLAKSISDAGWYTFKQMLSYKVVTVGGKLIEVNARGTTTTCNKCGHSEEMPLSVREFVCSYCKFSIGRDLNAAMNIHDRAGHARISTPVKTTASASPLGEVSGVTEAGTICHSS